MNLIVIALLVKSAVLTLPAVPAQLYVDVFQKDENLHTVQTHGSMHTDAFIFLAVIKSL